MTLRIDQIISLVDYLETFVDSKMALDAASRATTGPLSHAGVNRSRTALVDYIEELVGEKREN